MALFKRLISEADQFRSKTDTSTSSYPNVSFDPDSATGIYKSSDTQIAFTLQSEDAFYIRKGIIIMVDGNIIDSGVNNSIFISGNSLQFKDGAGVIRRLD